MAVGGVVAAAGAVHLAMSGLHGSGEFSAGHTDQSSVLFHLHRSARHRNAAAAWALARLYAGFSTEHLPPAHDGSPLPEGEASPPEAASVSPPPKN